MDLEGLDSLALARIARIEANRRTVMPPVMPSSAGSHRPSGCRPDPSVPGGVGSRLERRPERGWQQGWDLRSAVDVVVWYVNSAVDL
jgi:hypothetical protein